MLYFQIQTRNFYGIPRNSSNQKDKSKRSQYDLQEELRNDQKESNGSRGSRGPSDYCSSTFDGSANRRYWKQSWRTI
ncbi:unnamed protein product [Camellia sinensis]